MTTLEVSTRIKSEKDGTRIFVRESWENGAYFHEYDMGIWPMSEENATKMAHHLAMTWDDDMKLILVPQGVTSLEPQGDDE